MKTFLDLVGNTPLVELKRFSRPEKNVRIFAKLELFNPSGSLKDRIVKYMIEKAEREGKLKKDMVIVEASSGNTGIALSMVCNLKGYKCRIYMPESKSMERRVMIRAWGGELILTDPSNQNSHIEAAEELCAKEPDKYYYFNQNGDEGNTEAHYITGKEIARDLKDIGVDYFVAGLGTGGTLMGVSKALKEEFGERVKIIGVHPATAISKIEGLLHLDGSYIPPIWHQDKIDALEKVTDKEAFEYTRQLALKEGIFAGISSGANLCQALKIAEKTENANIVFICGDRGERYLSTKLCDIYRY